MKGSDNILANFKCLLYARFYTKSLTYSSYNLHSNTVEIKVIFLTILRWI